MKKPEKSQIETEIKKLKSLREIVRPTTSFGDSNKDAIDAQIAVLEKDTPTDDIYATSNDEGEHDESKWTHRQREYAIYARDWLDGTEEAKPPSEEWNTLVEPLLSKKGKSGGPAKASPAPSTAQSKSKKKQ
jgi:hypothetical protein